MFVYRVGYKNQIDSIFKNGYSRQFLASNEGTDYGDGVYCNINIRDSLERLRYTSGGCIIKNEIVGGLDRYLIFDEYISKRVYGNNNSIKEQVYYIFPQKVADKVWNDFNDIMKNFPSARNHMNGRTAELLQVLLSPRRHQHYRKEYEKLFKEYNVRGVIYRGLKDGLCLVAYDFGECIPVSYSVDGGKTFLKKEFKGFNIDVHNKYENKYKKIDYPIRISFDDEVLEFSRVLKKNGKYNYIDIQTGEEISPIDFDSATLMDPETGDFDIEYNGDFYIACPQGFFANDEEYELGKGHTFDELNEIKIMEKRIIKLTENELKSLIKEEIEKVLSESKNLVDNFDKVAKIMEFNSDDDFYFLQIIKRFKDNPSGNKTVGNYHAGAWYQKSYRIKSVEELMNLKDEIIKLCNKENARAYITVNNRSQSETDKQIIKVKNIYPSYDARHIHAHEIVPGQAKHGKNWAGQRKKFFIDIDTENQNVWNEVKKILKMCGMDILDEYITPNGGLHIIMPDKEHPNIDYMLQLFKKFDGWRDKGRLATAHTNFDGKILLYSNVDTKGY